MDRMRLTLLVTAFLWTVAVLRAQTYFYIDQIAVVPAAPTTQDAIEIHLSGGLSSTGSYIVSSSHQVVGNTVVLTVNAADNGGLTVIVPHTETLFVGTLSAGPWQIVVQGQAVLDLAPASQHQFVVSGSTTGACDSLLVMSLGYAAFTDTALVAGLENLGSAFFNYPGLLLRDDQGDTLAMETVNFFGLAGTSWHWLPLLPNVTLPTAPFSGTLEVWVDFFDSLACNYPVLLDPCPPAPCAVFHPALYNAGGAFALGTFNWTIFNGNGPVANGVFELTTQQQFTMDTICLPPGVYQMAVSANQPPSGGAPMFTVIDTHGGFSGPEQEVQTLLPVLMPFTLYGACADTPSGLPELEQAALRVGTGPGGLTLWATDGSPIGHMELFDATGRLLYAEEILTDRLTLEPRHLAPSITLIRARGTTIKVATHTLHHY